MKKKETFIFLHIPKCAGTSFTRLLEANIPFSEVFNFRPPYETQIDVLKSMAPTARNRLRLITGHLSYGVHELVDSPCTYLTMLRDPIDRVISLYDFIRQDQSHPLHDEVITMSLDEFSRGKCSSQITNCMTRQLSGNPAVDFLNGKETCSEEDLALAMKHLNSFAFIGLQEEFHTSMLLCRLLFGWTTIHHTRVNQTSHRTRLADLDEKTLEVLRTYNSIDLRLYEYGLQLFRTRVAERQRELSRLKSIHSLSSAVMHLRRRLGRRITGR